MPLIAERIEEVRARIAAAASRSGRDPSEVRLVAVQKVIDPADILEAVVAGVGDFGVNRAQEIRDKALLLPPEIRWHYLGAVQTNKVRYLDGVALVHGLARAKEAAALQARAEKLGRAFDVLIECNVAGERSKLGLDQAALPGLLDELEAFPLVKARGLMIVAPQVENHEDVRWVFERGRKLRDEYRGAEFVELSMGMSEDYEIAIEEGATIVRIGRSIFPSREN